MYKHDHNNNTSTQSTLTKIISNPDERLMVDISIWKKGKKHDQAGEKKIRSKMQVSEMTSSTSHKQKICTALWWTKYRVCEYGIWRTWQNRL